MKTEDNFCTFYYKTYSIVMFKSRLAIKVCLFVMLVVYCVLICLKSVKICTRAVAVISTVAPPCSIVQLCSHVLMTPIGGFIKALSLRWP